MTRPVGYGGEDVRMSMRVALFAACYNDLMWPETPKAVVRLLRRLGCEVIGRDPGAGPRHGRGATEPVSLFQDRHGQPLRRGRERRHQPRATRTQHQHIRPVRRHTPRPW